MAMLGDLHFAILCLVVRKTQKLTSCIFSIFMSTEVGTGARSDQPDAGETTLVTQQEW